LTSIAVFGGSFDPPHIGHEEIIEKALKELDIETLFVVPTFLNPFKKTFTASSEKRFTWIEKLLLPYKNAKALRYEIEQNRPVATIETIRYLLKTYDIDKIYLIIGADNIATLSSWSEYKELKKLVNFVVASRDDIKIPKNLQKLNICANISSTKLRKNIEKKYIPKSIADDVIEYYTKEKDEPKN
jgi:nicotinate-nucleotide adenylyltransferase